MVMLIVVMELVYILNLLNNLQFKTVKYIIIQQEKLGLFLLLNQNIYKLDTHIHTIIKVKKMELLNFK